MDPLQAISGISTALSAGTNLWNSIFAPNKQYNQTRNLMEYQNQMNKENAEWQNQVNIANWQMQNEYNTPAAQMERLREAGLNPNLMYGNGKTSTGLASDVSGASVSGASAGSAPDYQADFSSTLSVMSQIMDQKYKDQLLGSQADYYKALTAKSLQEQVNLQTRNAIDAIEKDRSHLNYQYEKQTFNQRILQSLLGVNKTQEEIRFITQGISESKSRIGLNESNLAVNAARLQEIQSKLKLNLAQALKVHSEIGEISARIANIQADTTGKNIQNRFDEDTFNDRKETIQNIVQESLYRAENGRVTFNKNELDYKLQERFGYRQGGDMVASLLGSLFGTLNKAFEIMQ